MNGPRREAFNMKIQIYGLFDGKGELRYIGQTSKSLNQRLDLHISKAFRVNKDGKFINNAYINCLIRSILKQDIKPTIQLIQEFYNGNDANSAEQYWIKFFREQGCRLTNIASGGMVGNRGLKHSDETRRKMSAAQKGRKMSEETKRKIGLAGIGRKHTEEARKKISDSRKGKIGYRPDYVHSEETKRKIGLANKGRKMSAYFNEKRALRMQGQPFPKKALEMALLANTGKPCSEETKRKIGLANKGRKLTEEQNIANSRRHGGRPFKDQYGNIYQTINSCARQLKLHSSNIRLVLNGKRKSCGGYNFKHIQEIGDLIYDKDSVS